MDKHNRSFMALGIFAAAYIVLAFAIPFVKNTVFWVSFAFSIIAIGLVALMIAKYPLGDNVRSRFYGFPLIGIALTYLVVQIAVGFVLMALAKIAPAWLSVVIYVLILAVSSIGFISSDAMRSEIEKMDEKLKADVTTMRDFQSKMATMLGRVGDEEAEKKIAELSEKMRYSDPVSNSSLTEIENELSALLDSLQQAVVDGDASATINLCNRAELTLAERNRLCKLGK